MYEFSFGTKLELESSGPVISWDMPVSPIAQWNLQNFLYGGWQQTLYTYQKCQIANEKLLLPFKMCDDILGGGREPVLPFIIMIIHQKWYIIPRNGTDGYG